MLKIKCSGNPRLIIVVLIVFVALLTFHNALYAQSDKEINGNKKLPLDTSLRTGILPNGFTYYIRKNTEPKGRIFFYLANKVGSILEDSDQLGLAHFMEHMNFKGTTHFPKYDLINYLQKIGVRFGADLNASTSFDETVYQLPIPADKPELVHNGLLIMHDWAQGATLDVNEINSERGVILEEKRSRNSAGLRMLMQEMPIVLNRSKYAYRWPIGKEEIIQNFKPVTLTRFYKDWYRPNLQALIIVGDFNADSMARVVKSQFSDLKNPENARPVIFYPTALTGENHFLTITDPEYTGTSIEVINKQPELLIKTYDGYKKNLIRLFFNQIMRGRFEELALQANPAFIDAGSNYGKYIAGHIDAYTSEVNLRPGEFESGFKALWRENLQAERFGFTLSELTRAKRQYLAGMESAILERNKTPSSKYANEYLRLFLNAEASPGTDQEHEIAKSLVQQIGVNDLNLLAKTLISDKNRDIILMASENEKGHLPDSSTVETWINAVNSETVKAYSDKLIIQPLLAKLPKPGKVISESIIPSLGITQLKLSNGINVLLKPTDYKNDQIVFNGFAVGGTNLYSDADFESADNAVSLIAGSGVGPFTSLGLNKLIAGDQIGVSPYMDEIYKGIRGTATPESLEKAFQLSYLYFTEPRLDTGNFNNFIARFKASIPERTNNPQAVFTDTVISIFHNNNRRFSPPTLERINDINLNKAYSIYKEEFENTGGFTFVIVGAFDIKKIKPLIEKYIASLPSAHKNDNIVNLGIEPIAGKLTTKVYAGKQEKSNVTLIFKGKYEFTPENNLQIDALGEILEYKLIERLRQTESGVYTPNVTVNRNKYPGSDYSIFISFECDPKNTDKLIRATIEEIDKIKLTGATDTDIQKYQEEARRAHEVNIKNNYFWFSYLTKTIKTGGDLKSILDFNKSLKEITSETVKKAASDFLDEDNLLKFILLPENYKESATELKH
jgi:zinc protease